VVKQCYPTHICRWKFVFQLKKLITDILLLEELIKKILKFKKSIPPPLPSPRMNRPEQESSLKQFLKKLLEFIKKIKVYYKNTIVMGIQFNETPDVIIWASCILQNASAKIYISFLVRSRYEKMQYLIWVTFIDFNIETTLFISCSELSWKL
jgi:hypothetical protein